MKTCDNNNYSQNEYFIKNVLKDCSKPYKQINRKCFARDVRPYGNSGKFHEMGDRVGYAS